MCSCILSLVTVSESVASTIEPVVASGAAGSKLTVPVTPLPAPVIDSSGASSRKVMLLTPLGSLKS